MNLRLALTIAAFALSACGGGMPPNDHGDSAMAPDAPDFSTPGGTLCTDPKADAWTLPIVKASVNGSFKVSLVSADYSPPIIGTNAWTFSVADANDAPLAAASVTALPWMPYMGHGTSVVPTVKVGTTAGDYTVDNLYYFMAGVWTATLTITNGSTTDTVVYGVCLAD